MKIERQPIKLLLDYCDKDGKFSTKEFTIKVEDIVSTEKYPDGTYTYGKRGYWKTYKSAYSMKIPDHIHEAIVGQTIWTNKLGDGFGEKYHDYSKDFPKTLRSSELSTLTEKWLQIIMDYKWTIKVKTAKLDKVIFYRVESNHGAKNSSWDSSKIGFEARLLFAFDIGYISKVDGKIVATYNRDKKQINTTSVREYKAMNMVAWTEERENFFANTIYKNLVGIINKLNEFQDNSTEKTIDALIKSNQLAINP